MEIWYDGHKRAVRNRAFSIDTQTHNRQPTILVGRNGSGKTLAASVLRKTREMLLEHGGDFAGGFADWLTFVRGVGIDSLGVRVVAYSHSFEFDDDLAAIPASMFDVVDEDEDERWCELESPTYPGISSRKHMLESGLEGCSFRAFAVLHFEDLLDNRPLISAHVEIEVCVYHDVELNDANGDEIHEYNVTTKERVPPKALFAEHMEESVLSFDVLDLFSQKIGEERGQLEHKAVEALKVALPRLSKNLTDEVGVQPAWETLPQREENAIQLFDDIDQTSFQSSFPIIHTINTERGWGDAEEAKLDRSLLQAFLNLGIRCETRFRIPRITDTPELFESQMSRDISRVLRYFKTQPGLYESIAFSVPIPSGHSFENIINGLNLPAPPDYEDRPSHRSIPTIGGWLDFSSNVIHSLIHGENSEAYRDAALKGRMAGKWYYEDVEEFLHSYLQWYFIENLLNSVEELTGTRLMLELVSFVFNDAQGASDLVTLLEIFGMASSENIPSGYRQLLTLVLGIADASEKVGDSSVVLFVDEPELSLHIDWQARLLERMLGLMKDLRPRSLGLLVATHSPGIIQNHLDSVVDFSLSDMTEGD